MIDWEGVVFIALYALLTAVAILAVLLMGTMVEVR